MYAFPALSLKMWKIPKNKIIGNLFLFVHREKI